MELPGAGTPREQAIPVLLEHYGDRLYALACRFCGDVEEARDLVQDTFLEAWRHWDQFEGRSRVSTWLYSIASRRCQRMHRKASGEPQRIESLEELLPFGSSPMAVVPRTGSSPEDEAIRREGRALIEAAIVGLPLEFRMPLVLHELVGLKLSEIAAILELPAATVKTRLHRARLRLRKALEAGLPLRDVPAAAYDRQVCLDLLQAKQEALDNGTDFTFPPGMVCERCGELFTSMDLAQDLCSEIAADGGMSAATRRQVLERLADRPEQA